MVFLKTSSKTSMKTSSPYVMKYSILIVWAFTFWVLGFWGLSLSEAFLPSSFQSMHFWFSWFYTSPPSPAYTFETSNANKSYSKAWFWIWPFSHTSETKITFSREVWRHRWGTQDNGLNSTKRRPSIRAKRWRIRRLGMLLLRGIFLGSSRAASISTNKTFTQWQRTCR